MAESTLFQQQSTKTYLGLAGDEESAREICGLVLDRKALCERVVSIQTPGGNGAFPVTLYKEQWRKILAMAGEIEGVRQEERKPAQDKGIGPHRERTSAWRYALG